MSGHCLLLDSQVRLIRALWARVADCDQTTRPELTSLSSCTDLHQPRTWSFSHVRSPALQQEFESVISSLTESLAFMRTIGVDPPSTTSSALASVDLFTSHEGLLLEVEEALTRCLLVPTVGHAILREKAKRSDDDRTPVTAHYNVGAHFIWIGDRTRSIKGAHIEYFRGVVNPIGLKVGPTMEVDELVRVLDILDPGREDGKVTLITRYGASRVSECLGAHIEAVKQSGHKVVWVCDPM